MTVFQFLRKLAGYFSAHKSPVALTLLACSIETGFYWVIPLSFRYLVDHAVTGIDRRSLLRVLMLLAGGSVLASLASLWRGRIWARLENQVVSDLRFRLFHQLQRLSTSYYSKTPTGEVLSRFSNDLAAVANALTMAVVWGILPGLDCVIGTVILAVLDWRLAMLAALVWPWCLLAPPRIGRRASSAAYARKEREAALLAVIQEEVAAHSVVRAYGLQRRTMMRFLRYDAKLFEASVGTSFLTALMDQSSFSGILLLQVASLGIGAAMVFSGVMTIGTLAAFQALFLSVSTSLLYCTQYFRGLLPARAGMQRIEDFLGEAAAIQDAPGSANLAPLSEAIVFDNVSFAYDGGLVLNKLSLRIERGSNVAIVGLSGSGKSTVVALLLRFHDPSAGAIRVDGCDLRGVAQESWRSQIGIVFQENLLFRDSIAENIRLGRPNASEEQVTEAASQAGIHEAITRMPERYATQAGERGDRLSGGERQRIALARALVRRPEILILDEATSALDPQTEREVNRTIRRAAVGRTVISVTHRLASVTRCDHIFVLDRGQLVEEGRHADLIRAGKIYALLWRMDQDRAKVSNF